MPDQGDNDNERYKERMPSPSTIWRRQSCKSFLTRKGQSDAVLHLRRILRADVPSVGYREDEAMTRAADDARAIIAGCDRTADCCSDVHASDCWHGYWADASRALKESNDDTQ